MAKSITVLAIAMLLGLGVIFARSSTQQEAKSSQQHKIKRDRKAESRRVYKGRGNNSMTIAEAGLKARRPHLTA